MADKHYFVYDRPHIYKCSCGVVRMIFITPEKTVEKDLEIPAFVEYLPCGHAVCARQVVGGEEICVICRNTGDKNG